MSAGRAAHALDAQRERASPASAPVFRPVYIQRIAHVSALGLSAAAAAKAFWANERRARWRDLPDARYPWFGLPLEEVEWSQRLCRVIEAIRAELRVDLTGLPLFLGSSSLQIGAFEAHARATKTALPHDPADIGAEIGALLSTQTDAWMFSTSCSSGLAALEAAFLMIAQGRMDAALVLGFEFANETTLAGFASLGLLASDEAADGLILGEAVGALLLSADPGCDAAWRVDACRLGMDAHSPTAPTPDGSIIAANLAAVLADAGLAAADIDLVKPHQGRIPATDAAEAAALARIFGRQRPPEITCKRQIGHTLGASGPAELTLLLALLATPEGVKRHGRPQRLLFNLIGFGGSIAALALSEHRAACLATPPEKGKSSERQDISRPGEASAAASTVTTVARPSPPVFHALSFEALDASARKHSTVSLRRADALAKMLIVGASACLADKPARPTLALLGSRSGMNAAARRLINDVVLAREPPLPFDFLATQPMLAAILAQQAFPCIENLLYQPWGKDTKQHWRRLHDLAAIWIKAGRCERVLCGEVELTEDGAQGRWQVVEKA